jgi:hypothetical protein
MPWDFPTRSCQSTASLNGTDMVVLGIKTCRLWKNENITFRDWIWNTRHSLYPHCQVRVKRVLRHVTHQTIHCAYLPFFSLPFFTEPRSAFFDRCQRSVDAFHQRHPFQPKQVFVMVSHAAGCLALAKTLAKKELQYITPAAPCSIYMFTRTSDTDTWTLDEHDAPDSMNGYTDHMPDLGKATKPWSNFGDGTTKFYTGPPNSRFHPDKL